MHVHENNGFRLQSVKNIYPACLHALPRSAQIRHPSLRFPRCCPILTDPRTLWEFYAVRQLRTVRETPATPRTLLGPHASRFFANSTLILNILCSNSTEFAKPCLAFGMHCCSPTRPCLRDAILPKRAAENVGFQQSEKYPRFRSGIVLRGVITFDANLCTYVTCIRGVCSARNRAETRRAIATSDPLGGGASAVK